MKKASIILALVVILGIIISTCQCTPTTEDSYPYVLRLEWRVDIPARVSCISASKNFETVAALIRSYPYSKLILFYRGNLCTIELKGLPIDGIWVTARGDYLLAHFTNGSLILLDENLRKVVHFGQMDDARNAIFSDNGEYFVVYGTRKLKYYSIWKIFPIYETSYINSILRVDVSSSGEYVLVAGFNTFCGACISEGLVYTKLAKSSGEYVSICDKLSSNCIGYLTHVLGPKGISARLKADVGRTLLVFYNDELKVIKKVSFPYKFKNLWNFNSKARVLKKGDRAIIAVDKGEGEWILYEIDFENLDIKYPGNLTEVKADFLDFSPSNVLIACRKVEQKIVLTVVNMTDRQVLAEIERALLDIREEVKSVEMSLDGRKVLLITTKAIECYSLQKKKAMPEKEKTRVIFQFTLEGNLTDISLELIDLETRQIVFSDTINTTILELYLPKKAYLLKAQAEGYVPQQVVFNLTLFNYTTVVPIYLTKVKQETLYRKVFVQVVDTKGCGLPTATILVYYNTRLVTAKITGTNGLAAFLLPKGNYSIEVSKEGYYSAYCNITVSESDVTIFVTLAKRIEEFTAVFHVFNYTGEPVKEFSLLIIEANTSKVLYKTKVEGNVYTAVLPKGIYTVFVNASGALPFNKTISVSTNTTLYITLSPVERKTLIPETLYTVLTTLFFLMALIIVMFVLMLTNEKIALRIVKHRRKIVTLTLIVVIAFILALSSLPMIYQQAPKLEEKAERPYDLSFKLVDGTAARLSDYRGKILIVELMSTECPTCEKIIPVLKEIYSKYRGIVEIISISIDPRDTAEILKAYAVKKDIPWKIGYNSTAVYTDKYLSKVFAGTPTILIIDREGYVRKVLYGAVSYEQFNEALSDILKSVEVSITSLLISTLVLGVLSNFSVCSFQQAVFLIGYLTGLEHSVRRTIAVTILYVLGLATMFIVIGVLIFQIGALAQNRSLLLLVGGIITVLIGLRMLNIIKPPKSKLLGDLFRKFRGVEESTVKSLAGAYALGLAVGAGFAWTQCLGSFLPAVMYALSYGFTDIKYGILVPLIYTIGFSVVFLVIALAIEFGMARLAKKSEKRLELIEKIFSLLILFFGIDMIVAGLFSTMTIFERIGQLVR